jgi:hypothetical protein
VEHDAESPEVSSSELLFCSEQEKIAVRKRLRLGVKQCLRVPVTRASPRSAIAIAQHDAQHINRLEDGSHCDKDLELQFFPCYYPRRSNSGW